MFLSHASVKRPIAMSCFIIALIFFGVNSYDRLGLDFFPSVDVPYITVTTLYPGASPEEIEVDVAKRIEDAVGTLDGLKLMNSTAMENACVTLLEFRLGVDVNVAAMDVRERIDQIKADLPAGAEAPEIKKFDTNATAIVTLGLTGNLPLDRIYDYADETFKTRISTIPGVGEVQIAGGEELELQIVLDKARLSSVNLTIPEVVAKIESANLKVPAGRIKNSVQEITVTYDSEFKNFEDVGALEIGNFKQKRIYLRDVADIRLQANEKRSLAFFDGRPGIMLKVIKKGEANALAVIRQVRAVTDQMTRSANWPGGIKLEWVRDSGEFVQASSDDAWGSIALGIVLTAVILFVFLHESRSTFIVVVSMPVSIVITFAAMRLAGYTFNMFTLLALGTSVGTLVSNSIVVIENIFKRLDRGDDPATAADLGAGEVAVPVFASAMTNVVVFVPVAMMSSLVGRFLVPFAVTTTIATLVSLFISFTLTPILAARLLRRELPEPNRFFRWIFALWNRLYGVVERGFAASIAPVAKFPGWTLLAAAALLVATLLLVLPRVGSTFVPENDQNEFTVKLEFPTDFNLEATLARTSEVAARLREVPEVLRTATVVGKVQGMVGQATEGVYLAEITVVTTDKNRRDVPMEQIRNALRAVLDSLSNCVVSINIPSAMGGSGTQMELKIVGDDLGELKRIGKAFGDAVRRGDAVHGKIATDVDTSVRPGKPEIRVVPKRTVLQNLDIGSGAIGTILRGSLEGIKAGTYKVGARSFDLRVKAAEQRGFDQINATNFTSSDGRPLSIEALSTLDHTVKDIQIIRAERERIVKLYANPADGVGLGDLVRWVEARGSSLLPPGYRIEFTGGVEKMAEANADFRQALILAVVLTYLLLAAILESWTRPFIIMFTVPLALIGVVMALWLTATPLSIFGMLGLVMLIGIVVNNAILIMDDAVINRDGGMSAHDAMLGAVNNKFRPIIMTSIAAILGILPMAIGTGLGAESRASCGIAVVGGLLSSTVLSLYVIPAMYIFFSRKKP